ncbi:MAG: hypothetical protein R3F14_05620 [Polyangiaceae bacterium]
MTASRHGPKLTATTGSQLSEHARQVFDELDLRRDASSVTSAEQLRSVLRARRLPVYDAVLDFEETASGARFWPGTALGVRTAIDAMEAAGGRLSAEQLEMVDGRPALPLLYCGDLSYWMDERGRICLVDLCPPIPAYDSLIQYLEHHSFVAERRGVDETKVHEDWHCVQGPPRLGAELSTRLGVSQFEPATGARLQVWWGSPLVIEDQTFGQFGEWTRAYTQSAGAAARALLEMEGIAPGQATWSGPAARVRRGRAALRHRIAGRSASGDAEVYEIWERAGALWIVRV